MGRKWDEKEDEILKDLVSKHGKQWALIASHLSHRTPSQVAARWEKCLDPIIVKGPFTPEEDALIVEFVQANGPRSWPRITELLPNRSSKQCRERWFNHLDPNVTKAQWTYEEDLKIFEEYMKIGGKWSHIAKLLPGRTDNAVKNRWNSSISKRVDKGPNGLQQLLPDSSKRVYKRHSSSHISSSSSSPEIENKIPKPPILGISTNQFHSIDNLSPILNNSAISFKSNEMTAKTEQSLNVSPSNEFCDSEEIQKSRKFIITPLSLMLTSPTTLSKNNFDASSLGASGIPFSPCPLPPFTQCSPVSPTIQFSDFK